MWDSHLVPPPGVALAVLVAHDAVACCTACCHESDLDILNSIQPVKNPALEVCSSLSCHCQVPALLQAEPQGTSISHESAFCRTSRLFRRTGLTRLGYFAARLGSTCTHQRVTYAPACFTRRTTPNTDAVRLSPHLLSLLPASCDSTDASPVRSTGENNLTALEGGLFGFFTHGCYVSTTASRARR